MQDPRAAREDFIEGTTNNITDLLYNMTRRTQPTRTGSSEPNSRVNYYKNAAKKPEVQRNARATNLQKNSKLQRELRAQKVRQGDEMETETPTPRRGKGWGTAARALAPMMQIGFTMYQQHQHNEAARRRREMLAERLGVDPEELEGI
jgi:response regulator RpfG family c-di-GMP phosphodiesterase